MIYDAGSIKKFKDRLRPDTPLLGIDYGEKRTGFAVSDRRRSFASTLRTVETKDFFREAEKIRLEKEACGFAIGLPLQMDGMAGEMAQKTMAFAQKVAETFGLPVLVWDERLSSRAAEAFLTKEAGMRRGKRREVLDSSAAQFILQGVLDRLAFLD